MSAPIGNGTIDLAEEARRAFHHPGVTKGQLEAFKRAAEAAQRRDETADEEQAQLAQLNGTFAAILGFINGNDKALAILIGLLAVMIAYYAVYQAHADSAESHQDALNQLKATQSVEQATLTAAQVQSKIDAEIVKLNAAVQQPAARPVTTRGMPPECLPQNPPGGVGANRHDRRAADSRARKGKR